MVEIKHEFTIIASRLHFNLHHLLDRPSRMNFALPINPLRSDQLTKNPTFLHPSSTAVMLRHDGIPFSSLVPPRARCSALRPSLPCLPSHISHTNCTHMQKRSTGKQVQDANKLEQHFRIYSSRERARESLSYSNNQQVVSTTSSSTSRSHTVAAYLNNSSTAWSQAQAQPQQQHQSAKVITEPVFIFDLTYLI